MQSRLNAGAPLPGAIPPMHRWGGAHGVTLAGDSWGNPDGPLVILLHGGGQTRHAWRNVGRTLAAAGFHAVAFDARGHGDSDWAVDGRYSQDAMVEDLQCLLAALGNKRPSLVGASMGGGTSLVAVGEGHVDASALVLVDIAPRIEPEGVEKIRSFMAQRPEGFDTLDEVADAIASYQPHRTRPKNLQGLAKNVRLDSDGKYRWHWDPRYRANQIDFEKRKERLEACARALDLPTLLVRGGLSDVLTEEGVREFLALAPRSEYVNVGSAGHMIAGDRNDVFGAAVTEFLNRAVVVSGRPAQLVKGASARPRADDVDDVP